MGRAGWPRVMRAAASVQTRRGPTISPGLSRRDRVPRNRCKSAAAWRCRPDARPGTARRRTFRLSGLLGGVPASARAGEGQPRRCARKPRREREQERRRPVNAPGRACSPRPPHNRSHRRTASWRSRTDRRCRAATAPCWRRPSARDLIAGRGIDLDHLAVLPVGDEQVAVGRRRHRQRALQQPVLGDSRPVPALSVRVAASGMAAMRLPSASET